MGWRGEILQVKARNTHLEVHVTMQPLQGNCSETRRWKVIITINKLITLLFVGVAAGGFL